jgi:hypothetical protein
MIRRTRLAYILCLLLTFQLSWNVITSYCMHETGRAADHFGHHVHNNNLDDLSGISADSGHVTKKGTVHDAHCGAFAHMTLATLAQVDTPLPILNDSEQVSLSALARPASIFLPPPERPQWAGRA